VVLGEGVASDERSSPVAAQPPPQNYDARPPPTSDLAGASGASSTAKSLATSSSVATLILAKEGGRPSSCTAAAGCDQGSGFRVSEFRVQGAGFRVQGSVFRVQSSSSGFRVQGSGFRVQGYRRSLFLRLHPRQRIYLIAFDASKFTTHMLYYY